ncbi:MAG: outer membrane beta-barrel protein [Myxococcota bacterium]|jgi:outer membrane beta-barrel protein
MRALLLHNIRTAVLSLGLVVATTSVVAPVAHAEESVLEDAPPIMRGFKILDGRHSIAPQFGMTLNDEYERNLMAGLAYRYYLASWIGIGVDVWGGGSISTTLTEDITRELSRPDQPFELSTSSIRLLAGATIEIVPFVGKAMIFGDELSRVELHLSLGIGVALLNGSGSIDDSASVSPNFGAGIRFFPNSWVAVGVEVRDHLISRVLASRRDGSTPGASFEHNWLFGLSVGFYFPTLPEVDDESSIVRPAGE